MLRFTVIFVQTCGIAWQSKLHGSQPNCFRNPPAQLPSPQPSCKEEDPLVPQLPPSYCLTQVQCQEWSGTRLGQAVKCYLRSLALVRAQMHRRLESSLPLWDTVEFNRYAFQLLPATGFNLNWRMGDCCTLSPLLLLAFTFIDSDIMRSLGMKHWFNAGKMLGDFFKNNVKDRAAESWKAC